MRMLDIHGYNCGTTKNPYRQAWNHQRRKKDTRR